MSNNYGGDERHEHQQNINILEQRNDQVILVKKIPY